MIPRKSAKSQIILGGVSQEDKKGKQLEFNKAKSTLSRYLNGNSYGEQNEEAELSQEKEAFANQYNLHRDTLDVAKDNPYIQAYTYLRDAYRAYGKNDFEKAAAQYKAGGELLIGFDDTHPLIKEDYDFRAKKANIYRTYCRTRPIQEPVVERSLTGAIASHFSRALKYISSDLSDTSSDNSSDSKDTHKMD
jgi:hypothetical protein